MNSSALENTKLTDIANQISFYPCDIGDYKFISDFVKVPIDRDSIIQNIKSQSYVNFSFFSNFLKQIQERLNIEIKKGYKVRLFTNHPKNVEAANNFVKLAEESISWNSEYHLCDLIGSNADLFKINFSIYLRVAFTQCSEDPEYLVPEIYGSLKINARNIEDKKQNNFAEIKTIKLT